MPFHAFFAVLHPARFACWFHAQWRPLAAAEAALAAAGAAGMPVRRPRRPAAASAAVAADAEPDLSCAVEDERTAKPPIGEVSSLSVGLSVSRWVCLV